MVSYDLSALDACHSRSSKGKPTGDCNALADGDLAQMACQATLGPPVDETQRDTSCKGVMRANDGIAAGFACQPTSPVLQNYPPNAVSGTGSTASVELALDVLGPVMLSTVGKSGAELQRAGAGSTPVKAKAVRRCRNAIGHARTKIVTRVVAAATACQRKIDKRSTTFGAIDPSCQIGRASG